MTRTVLSDLSNDQKGPFFILAPMDDVTDTVFRQIIADTAAPDLFFTEFVNVDGLQSPGREKIIHKLQFTDKERPLIAQVWGKNPDNYREVAKQIKAMGFAGIDINMGCPAKPVVQNGCCSALINNRELAGDIIKAVREGAGPDFPVSVKTRLGFGQVDLTWIEFLLGHDIDMLTIHGRTVREMSKVPAHWDIIGEAVKLRDKVAPEVLIVGNGDVESRGQGDQLAEQYGLDGIMVGRGVFHDPYVFAKETPWPDMSKQQKIDLYVKHVELFAKTWENAQRRMVTLNKFCKIYIEGFPGAKELREQLMNTESIEQLLYLLKENR